MAPMEPTGPKSETERRYVAMFRRFIRAVEAGHSRRAAALGGQLDRVAATIGKDRESQLLQWVNFGGVTKNRRRRSG